MNRLTVKLQSLGQTARDLFGARVGVWELMVVIQTTIYLVCQLFFAPTLEALTIQARVLHLLQTVWPYFAVYSLSIQFLRFLAILAEAPRARIIFATLEALTWTGVGILHILEVPQLNPAMFLVLMVSNLVVLFRRVAANERDRQIRIHGAGHFLGMTR